MSVRDQRGDVYMNSIDHTGIMVAKATPAIVGTGVSFTSVPWADIAAFLTCLYTTFLIAEWLWKKFKALRAMKKIKE